MKCTVHWSSSKAVFESIFDACLYARQKRGWVEVSNKTGIVAQFHDGKATDPFVGYYWPVGEVKEHRRPSNLELFWSGVNAERRRLNLPEALYGEALEMYGDALREGRLPKEEKNTLT